jgi:two-component system sensor histidine kinase KdpD
MNLGRPAPWIGLLLGGVVVVLATLVSWTLLGPGQLADVVMVYLLGVVVVSMRFGYGPSLLAAVLSVLCFDFFFIPPYFTLRVADFRHVATFGVMFLVAVVISGLTKRVRDQAEAAREREQRTASLYALSREVAGAKTVAEVVEVGTRHVREIFGGVAEVSGITGDAGPGPDIVVASRALELPLLASRGSVGVLRVEPAEMSALSDAEQRRHLEAIADQIAAAIERGQLADEAHDARLRVEAEQLRNAVLSSVSHDLRTPLAVVTGAASTLLKERLEPLVRRELTETILQEADRLNRLVQNLLDMSRLEAGAIRVKKQWQPIEEGIGTALNRMEKVLGNRVVTVTLPDTLTLVPLDSVLMEQVFVNLLENAAKYTPPGTPIEVETRLAKDHVEIEIRDRGPGLPEGQEARIFEKFHRGRTEGGGAGLGLAICRGIVLAHGGRIWAEQRAEGGACFHIVLPIEGAPPTLADSAPMDAGEPGGVEEPARS